MDQNRQFLKRTLAGLFVILFQASLSWGAGSALTEASILKIYSLEQLDAAANVLVVAVDQDLGPSINANPFCGLGKKEALVLLRPLKSAIDQKKKHKEEELFSSAQNAEARAQAARKCESRCHCGVYASIFENRELDGTDKKTLERLNRIASRQSAKTALACARAQGWFCQSRLLKYLREEAPGYEPPTE